MLKRMTGFTIVELLVVISTIVILAAITIVLYDGGQVQARNAQTAAAVRVYKDALLLYGSINHTYPVGNTTTGSICLGDQYPSDTCWFNNVYENAAFTTQLKGIQGGSLPMPALNPKNLKGATFQPVRSASNLTLDGVSTNFIIYAWEGTTPCGVGPVASNAGDANVLTYSATAPASGQTEPPSGANPAQCFIPLPAA